NRLDAGEDLDADNQLDRGGASFAAVVSGPLVATKDASNPAYFADYPASIARVDKIRYTCSDDLSVLILDGDASQSTLGSFVTARVLNAAGAQVDSESNFSFEGSNSIFTSGPFPVRQATVGTSDNGVLEGDTGYTIEVSYADPTGGSRTVLARAPMNCDPNFIGGVFGNPGERNKSDLVFGGCDNDQFFDKNEIVTYSVAVVNNDLFDQYTDVTATLRACAVPFVSGSCSTPSTVLTILDSPKNIGRLPVGQPEAVSFTVQVGATPLAQGPRVYLRVDLSQTGTAKDLSRLTFEFVHAMGADRESLHYSTDYPAGSGGTITRDLNRSLVIEPNDRPGLTLGLLDETVNFSSLFTPVSGAVGDPGRINNVQCTGPGTPHAGCVAADEAYPAMGIFTAATAGDGVLDRHVLVDSSPAGTDMIPWSFDANNGGWYTARDAATILGTSPATLPVWHWVNNGTCGFQSQSKTNCVLANGTPGNDPDGPGGAPCAALTAGAFVGGVWHTGSGVAGGCTGPAPIEPCYLNSDCPVGQTCTGGADNPQCGNFGTAFNAGTSVRAEYLHDYLVSPILEKVNQGNDANGFPFVVEFQRLAFNNTVQIDYADNTLYVNIDNNADSNNNNSIIKPGVFRGDGFAYYNFAITGPIDPYYTQSFYNQTTFGPLSDPDGSLAGGTPALTGDESGFTGFDNASLNPYAVKPIIPQAPINLRPFPGANEVHVGGDDVAGPSRSIEQDLVGYEDAIQFFTPGDAGNRFQIGLSFLDVEQAGGGGRGDFGFSIDDVVFEWDEVHPVAEAT
ncbi:MAG TPA: hypothetical protein VFU23_06585, partial [Gemmatimonadales bacterium]|nr:hypothetical protein [Gemmatimonadales bacterium]